MKANLPHASNAPSSHPPKVKTQAIVVDNSGKYKLNGEDITLPALSTRLAAIKAANPDVPVVIRGDSATPYQAVMDVMSTVANLGITQVGLATKAGK
jgi:biopolymer transport protein ExbD